MAEKYEPNYLKMTGDALDIGSKVFGLISSFSKKNKKSKENNATINRTIRNNQRLSERFGGPNTADIASTAGQFLSEAIYRSVPRSIPAGDRLIRDNYDKYNRVMGAASHEMNNFRYSPAKNFTTIL